MHNLIMDDEFVWMIGQLLGAGIMLTIAAVVCNYMVKTYKMRHGFWFLFWLFPWSLLPFVFRTLANDCNTDKEESVYVINVKLSPQVYALLLKELLIKSPDTDILDNNMVKMELGREVSRKLILWQIAKTRAGKK